MEHPESPSESESLPPQTPADAAAPADDLPEWEPLSPELLEDEAIRGDFVLRWAVAGVAFLLGCAQLTDARPLTHVRFGEWLATHGVLPSGSDPFSITAVERPWVNLSWLFDLCVAGVHAVMGPIGLSLSQGLLAAAAWALLSHAYRPGIRTWWGSVCATLALLAAMPRLNLTPELITLCGTAAWLWLLVRCEDGRSSWWWFVPLMGVWAQLDPRAWMGGALLLLLLVGLWLSRVEADAAWRAAWKPLLAGTAILLVHPFLWETWLSPVTLYGVEYPALRAAYPRPTVYDQAWYPLWSPLLWRQIDFRILAGLLLMVLAGATLWLDRARTTWSHGLLYLGANAAGLLTLHELPVAACVNCALATVHAQAWYLARFGQVYSVNWPEVVFSRGGRAVTVFTLFGLAWLTISGRIDGPDGRRTGVGLDRQLRAELDSFGKLPEFAVNDRAFHLTIRQGDALIAAGRRSFVDHRIPLFVGEGSANLLAQHDRARRSLRRMHVSDLTLDPNAWKDVLLEHRVSHVLPRLTLGVTGPDYESLFELLNNPEFALSQLLPATAVVHWTGSPEPAVRQYAQEHPLNPLEEAFRKPADVREQPREHTVTPHWSQQLFALPRRQPGGSTLLAMHWTQLMTAAPSAPWTSQAACLVLAVRSAQAGIQETRDVPAAYTTLAEAYLLLRAVEAGPLSQTGMSWDTSLRYYQAIAALREALRLNPDNLSGRASLVDVYQLARRVDAAHEELKQIIERTPIPELADEAAWQQRERLLQMSEELGGRSEKLAELAREQLDKGAERLQVATALYQNGAVLQAAKVLQDDAVYVERNPAARQLLTAALAELGAGQDVENSVQRLSAVAEAAGLPHWRNIVALVALGRGDYLEAIGQWSRELDLGDKEILQGVLYTAPLTVSSPLWLGDLRFPMSHSTLVQEGFARRPHEAAVLEFNRAACELERGNVEGAAAAIRRALDRAPESPLRPLLVLYLFGLTGEQIDFDPPSEWIPLKEIFAPDEP